MFYKLFFHGWYSKYAVSLFLQNLHNAGSIRFQLAESSMSSVKRHLWYLTEDVVIFALFDSDLPVAEKQEMAQTLLQIPRPRVMPLGKPAMPFAQVTGVASPQLASFVGPRSWKLWDLLGIGSDWLHLPVVEWQNNPDYQEAEQFVKGLVVVNDGVERCIRSITDYAAATKDSVYREDILLVGNSHREVFQDLRRAALAGLN